MITYTTIIKGVKYHKVEGNLQNVIKSIFVNKIGIDGDYQSEFTDKLEFETPHESQFTPYEDITAPMMLGWIDSHPSQFNVKSEQYISVAIQQKIDSNEVETDKLPFVQ
jgi:hypothetical protein